MSSKKDSNNGTTQKLATTTYEFDQTPLMPEKKHWTKTVWNGEEKAFFGRNAKNWGQLGLFYLIFYIVLAALCSVCMQGLFLTLSDEYPKWQLNSSLIGTNPGVAYRPIHEDPEKLSSGLVYNSTNSKSVNEWVRFTDAFLGPYNQSIILENGKQRKLCSFLQPPKPHEVCAVEVTNLGKCSLGTKYGFDQSKPCFFLKLNKIFAWVPYYYDDVSSLHPDMPEDLVEFIKTRRADERKQVWLSCRGHRANDVAKVQKIDYPVGQGIPGYYYPYMNIPGYISPLLPVQISVQTNTTVSIECRYWAKNIIYNDSLRERSGSVLIELTTQT